jgi:hypothetical protein
MWKALSIPKPTTPKNGRKYSHDDGRFSVKLLGEFDVYAHLMESLPSAGHDHKELFRDLAPMLKRALSCVIEAWDDEQADRNILLDKVMAIADFAVEGAERMKESRTNCKQHLDAAWGDLKADGLTLDEIMGDPDLSLQLETLKSYFEQARASEEAYQQLASIVDKYRTSIRASMLWDCTVALIVASSNPPSPKICQIKKKALVQGYLDDYSLPKGLQPYAVHADQVRILKEGLSCTIVVGHVKFLFQPAGTTPHAATAVATPRERCLHKRSHAERVREGLGPA